ncbi:gamma-glutamyltransferase [Alkalicoccus chagannorensis]|uniref:gamma-glutamyltransferase n=1 Tax=Alkalicoccus chagannorensis TaxID=427072 RepID=UPI000404DD8D|nr:gamma-glutamyltransferase [Alkalicoccus chagannorensis]
MTIPHRLYAGGLTALLLATTVLPADVSAQSTKDQNASVTGLGGAVSSEDPEATQIGMDILDQGGNAVDAAVATAAAQGVTRPFSGGIGGGGMMLVHMEGEDEPIVIDSRSQAASAFDETTFRNPADGLVYPSAARISSGASFAVPGTVKNWETALDEYGTMPLADVLEPAAALAEEGFAVDDNYVRELRENEDRFRLFASTEDLYFNENGELPEAGDTVQNPDLAAVYRELGDEGAAAFYEGALAEAVVDTAANPPLVNQPDYEAVDEDWETSIGMLEGSVTMEDMRSYETSTRPALSSTYRDYELYGAAPPSSGGITIGQTLNMMEGVDIGASKTDGYHTFLEASRLAFADRDEYIGDPAFTDVPINGLLSDGFAEERRRHIDPEAATIGYAAYGDPARYEANPSLQPGTESPRTFATDFSGEDGGEWDRSAFHRLDGGAASSPDDASFTIENNQGVFSLNPPRGDRSTSYGRAAATMDPVADPSLTTSFQFSNSTDDQRLRFWLQADVWQSGSSIPENGYGLEINTGSGNASFVLADDGDFSRPTTINQAVTSDTQQLRFTVDGDQLAFRIWENGEPEPAAWTGTHTLSESEQVPYDKGNMLFSGIHFSGQNSQEFRFNEMSVESASGSIGTSDADASIQSVTEPEADTAEAQQQEEDAQREREAEEQALDADESTIHLSTADEDGNVVGYTTTIVSIGGSGIVVPDAGFLLNNAMYTRTANAPRTSPNDPRGGMRTLSSMAPTLLMKDGEPALTVGAPGSGTILTTVTQLLMSYVDFDLTLPEAIREPRVSQRNRFNSKTDIEQEYWNSEFDAMKDDWEARGHRFDSRKAEQGIGAVTGIEFLDNGLVRPAAEEIRRGGGSAAVQSPLAGSTFIDINGHWAELEIRAMVGAGVILGRSADTFAPQADVTRAEFATLITRAFDLEGEASGDQPFADVGGGQWYTDYIDAASSAGIVEGSTTSTGRTFQPNATITREEMAAMLVRAVERDTGSTLAAGDLAFTDNSEIASWAETDVAKAAEAGLIEGDPNGAFQPKASATRAESATVFFRALQP